MAKRFGKFKGITKRESALSLIDGGSINGSLTVAGASSFGGTLTSTGAIKANASQNWLGIKKFQSFAGTLAATNGGSVTYGANDVLVELGELDTTVPSGHVAATKFFIDKVVIGITTAAGVTLAGKLDLSATTGTATNTAVASATEICGAGVASFNPRISATDSVTEIDIDLNATAGTYHVFEPNITAAIASKYLYVATETAVSSDTAQQGRFTVLVEYTVF